MEQTFKGFSTTCSHMSWRAERATTSSSAGPDQWNHTGYWTFYKLFILPNYFFSTSEGHRKHRKLPHENILKLQVDF